MRSLMQSAWALLGSVPVLAAPALPGPLPATSVEFAPRAHAQLQRYGDDEAGVLRAAILAAVSRETGRVRFARALTVTVIVQDVAPTRPTRKELQDDPALDAVNSKFQGGAELTGYVRDADQRVVARVSYRRFAPTLELGSASFEPWADARLAIDEFAVRLAAACRNLPREYSGT
jgi:hypothetical protein